MVFFSFSLNSVSREKKNHGHSHMKTVFAKNCNWIRHNVTNNWVRIGYCLFTKIHVNDVEEKKNEISLNMTTDNTNKVFQTFIYCEEQTAFRFLTISMIRTLHSRKIFRWLIFLWHQLFKCKVSLYECNGEKRQSGTLFFSRIEKGEVDGRQNGNEETPKRRKNEMTKWWNDEMKWKLYGFLFTVECNIILFKWKSFSDTTCQWLQHVKKRNKTMNSSSVGKKGRKEKGEFDKDENCKKGSNIM